MFMQKTCFNLAPTLKTAIWHFFFAVGAAVFSKTIDRHQAALIVIQTPVKAALATD